MKAKMEQSRLPFGGLDRYARYYAGITAENGYRTIVGRLPPAGGNDLPGVHVMDPGPHSSRQKVALQLRN
jgi:hypothetical protein